VSEKDISLSIENKISTTEMPTTEIPAAEMPTTEVPTEEILSGIAQLLCEYRPSVSDTLEKACEQYPDLKEIVEIITDIRMLSSALSKGGFHETVPSKGFILSSMKALQSNLRHLVWQMEQLSQGDFSQRIDFLGTVSEAFNAMCEKLYSQKSILQEMAQYDGLTKLANRQYLTIYLTDLYNTARALNKTFTVLMVDIDFFKKINDTHGHDVGDVVLQVVAVYLNHIFRSTDFIARYGGEEFLVILPEQPLHIAKQVAQRALEYFNNNPIRVNENLEIPLTVSIGLSEFHDQDTSIEQVIKRSDTALYQAKNNGRNRMEFLTCE